MVKSLSTRLKRPRITDTWDAKPAITAEFPSHPSGHKEIPGCIFLWSESGTHFKDCIVTGFCFQHDSSILKKPSDKLLVLTHTFLENSHS